MIDLYFWITPNGYKVTILLEELGLKYNVIPIRIGKGDQFKPEFLKVSPNNKIPAMVDYAVDRYTNEAKRIYGVIDKRVAAAGYIAGEYSIADMATYPWLRTHH